MTYLLWEVTRRNALGWAVERRNRLTGKYQHISYLETGKWKPGKLRD